MVSFRKAFLLLAILVTVASIASAQANAPALCTAYTSNVPNVRSEGVAEEVGQVVIECRGGTSALRGATLNTINIQIFLDTQVTSRRTVANDNAALEALLLMDDPTPAQVTTSTICTAANAVDIAGPCKGMAVGGGIYNDPAGVIVNKNVFQGRLVSTNSILWQGVPFDAPGTTPVRLLRIVNVRANANGLPLSTLLPTPVRMYISISGTAAPNLSVSQLNVAYLQKGLNFSSRDDGNVYLQCETSSGDFGSSSSSLKKFRLRFRENFPTAFRDNNYTSIGGNQADLTKIYNTESMYYHPTVAGYTDLSGAGIATQPTRLMATFTNIPSNVSIRLPRTLSFSSTGDSIKYMACVDSNGQSCSDSLLSGSSVTPSITGGTLTVVYEIVTSNSTTSADIEIPAELLWSASTPPTPPGTVSVVGSYAPLSTTTASVKEPAPRFRPDTNDPARTFQIAACKTNLLFPYVTNQGGFDTGLVISNTSMDRFGTTKQNGKCQIQYYGNIDGAAIPEEDAVQTTEVLDAGTQAIGLVSSGIKGTKGLPKFGGYVIAACDFQYGHGYAFIYTGGASFAGAQGYLALVLDGDKDYVKSGTLTFDPSKNTGSITLNAPQTRTKSISEVLGQ